MVICLTIRLTVAGNAVSFLGWSHKEKFMTAISWIPKATVQVTKIRYNSINYNIINLVLYISHRLRLGEQL